MRLFAIADLHLGFSTGKWMDRFGDHWNEHPEKIAAAWRDRVSNEDIVLLPGDFSWAMKPAEVSVEFEWLAALPGRKVLVKGNHDYWWPKSVTKLQALLPPDTFAIKKRSVVVDGVPFVGVRGGDFATREGEVTDEIRRNLDREERELRASIEHLEHTYRGDVAPIALFHYPPYPIGSYASRFTEILEEAGCRACVFGHLHSAPEWEAVFQGRSGGIDYRLVACDAIGFAPLLLDVDPLGA